MNRPDFSMYLAHFAKDGALCSIDDPNYTNIAGLTAIQRLEKILREKSIKATKMPWTGAHAVCFTECPWSSLIAHTKQYSPYGIGFSKQIVYSKHGGPAYYVRPDHLKKQLSTGKFDKQLWPFVTPFSPSYRPNHMKGKYFSTVDFSHEREWRVPHDFPFEYRDVAFIILKDYHDMAAFSKDLKDAIGRDKFILIDNYEHVEKLWPVHLV